MGLYLVGGAEGVRTHSLCRARAALSQMSYGPKSCRDILSNPRKPYHKTFTTTATSDLMQLLFEKAGQLPSRYYMVAGSWQLGIGDKIRRLMSMIGKKPFCGITVLLVIMALLLVSCGGSNGSNGVEGGNGSGKRNANGGGQGRHD